MFMHFRPRERPNWWGEQGSFSSGAVEWSRRHEVAAAAEAAQLLRRRTAHEALEKAHASLLHAAAEREAAAAAMGPVDLGAAEEETVGEAWQERQEL